MEVLNLGSLGRLGARNQRQFDQLSEDARLFHLQSSQQKKEQTQQLRQLEQEMLGITWNGSGSAEFTSLLTHVYTRKIRFSQLCCGFVLKLWCHGSPRKEDATQRETTSQLRWAKCLERWAVALEAEGSEAFVAFVAWKRRWCHLRQVQRMEPWRRPDRQT